MKVRWRAAFIWILYLTFIQALPCAQGKGIYVQDSKIVFENSYVRLVVGQDGFIKSLIETVSNTEYLDASIIQPFMYVIKSGKEYGSSTVTLTDAMLRVQFGESNVTGLVKVNVRDDCFIFELAEVGGQGVEVFGLARLHATISDHIGRHLNIAYNDHFGLCLMGLNLQTNAAAESAEHAILNVSCIPRFGMVGSRFALIGVPIKEMLPIIGNLELEFGLPHPTLDGEWDKMSRAVETSYLFTDGSQANIDSCIQYAKAGGFSYILLLGQCFSSYGHYEFNRDMFPDGLNGLKATMKKIHDAGLKGGIHFLLGWISKDDPYVTPVPDKRLAKDGEFLLVNDISADADFIPTRESPDKFPIEPGYFRGGCELQIGDELIRYTGLSTVPPYGFTGCNRGIHGTRASSHKKGATVYHMLEVYRHYAVGADTDMLDEMASRMGRIFNECEVDMVYYDGSETMGDLGPAWYYVPKVQEAFHNKFKREVFSKGSDGIGYCWHMRSQGVANDWVALDAKRWLDYHKLPERARMWENNLMPAEFGWWGYFTHSPSVDASLPDEVEYGCSKGAGYGAPLGFETHIRELAGNGRTDEVLSMIKRWEDLRLSGTLSEKTKKDLQILGQEHTLIQDENGDWNIHRISYGPDHYVRRHVPSTMEWKYRNQYPDQEVKIRIRALCYHTEYGNPANIILTDFDTMKPHQIRSSSEDVAMTASASSEPAKIGTKSLKITGTNSLNAKSSWVELEYRLDKPLNLLNHRGIGVWIYGDGSGAILNICPTESGGRFHRDYCIRLDFAGWKYFEFSEPNATCVYEHEWPYDAKWSCRPIKYESIGRLLVYLNEIPAKSTVTCYLSPIEALADRPTVIENSTLVINGNSVVFPVSLKDDEYLEYWGTGTAKVCDPNNHVLREIQPEGQAMVKSGTNSAIFRCRSKFDNYRAKVTIMTIGEALKN